MLDNTKAPLHEVVYKGQFGKVTLRFRSEDTGDGIFRVNKFAAKRLNAIASSVEKYNSDWFVKTEGYDEYLIPPWAVKIITTR